MTWELEKIENNRIRLNLLHTGFEAGAGYEVRERSEILQDTNTATILLAAIVIADGLFVARFSIWSTDACIIIKIFCNYFTLR